MTSEQLLSISVKERHPPSRRNKPFVSLLGQEEESSRSRSESNSELLARASLSSEVGDSPEGIEASTEQAQRFAYFTENYSASVNQRFQSSGENNATFSAEKPLNTEDSQPVETDELCVLFDVSGSLIREPTVDKPFRIEDVDSIQGIEKYTFSLCDLLTLTRSSLPQQRIAALKAICNVFRSTTDGTLTDDEACSVLEQFQRCNGPSTLIDLLEIPNYMVFYYLLSIVSSLILEVEGYLNHFEERWNTVGLLEEDLQKLKWSSNGTVSENSDSLKNVRSWKKPLIAARLVECFFLSKFLDKLQRFENLSALRNRAYYILALLFVSYIVYYWLQQEGLRCKVAFEIGKVLVKNRKSYDDNFLAKMMTWCLIVLPTSGECLSVVLKLESEKTLYYRIQSLRIVMHLTDGNLVQFDVWCYLKTMIENWKSTDYLIEALPTRECLLLCIEYCKLAKIQNILLDDDASNICPEIFSLLNFLMDYLNGNDDEAIRFYILLVAELFVRLFLGSTPSIRCSLEKRMESLYSYLVSMLNHLQSSCYAGMESVEFVYSQDTEKRAFIFMALRILCLLDRNIHLYFPDIEKLINHAWTTIAKYKDTNKDIFAVSLGIESSKHVYYMVMFLADFHLKCFIDRHAVSELESCLRLVSIVQSLGLFNICKNYYSYVFAPDSLSIAFSSLDEVNILSSFLEAQIGNILEKYREFWWWSVLSYFVHLETFNYDDRRRLVLVLRYFLFLVKQTDVFEPMYPILFYKIMRQILNGTESWHLLVEQELEELIFYLLSYDSYHSCVLYLETADLGSGLVDSLVDMAYRHLFSNDIMASKMTEVFQTTIFHFLLNSSYKEEFRLGLWRKCVKCNFQLCDPLWITGPLCQYMKSCTYDLCFIMEALGDICQGLVNREVCYFTYKSLCIRVAKTVFQKPHYWHLLNTVLSYSSLYDITDITTEVFISDINLNEKEYNQKPGVHSQMEVFQLFQNANVSEEKLKQRLKLAAQYLGSFDQLLQNCPFLHSLYASIANS